MEASWEQRNKIRRNKRAEIKAGVATHKKLKKTSDSQDNAGVKSRTEPIVHYQEGQNITVKDHKINKVTHQTDNTVMIYNVTTREVCIDK